MTHEEICKKVRDIADFPKPGILFKDLTTVFKDAEAIESLGEELYQLYKDKGITKVAAIESRGFIMGAILAAKLGAGFIPIRKPGKLPAETYKESFAKEYGTDTIEIHCDAIDNNDTVLIHDDVLATGGTIIAAVNLVKQFNPQKIHINFLSEITAIDGRKNLPKDIEIKSIIKF